MNVTVIPRAPFLPHSERLLRHLLRQAEQAGEIVLEVGCGEASCLVPYLQRIWSGAVLHQIDVRPEVIPLAQKHNPHGEVRQMNLADMSGFEENSFDAIIAMSVFDQNPLKSMPVIAQEMHRVLRPGGVVAYIHNEEVNAPAASASAMELEPPQCLLPNNEWQPNNDLEYCTAPLGDVRKSLQNADGAAEMLRKYVDVFHPTPEQLRRNGGKVQVPLVRQLTPQIMLKLREQVAELRKTVLVTDRRTPSFLNERIEHCLLGAANGFQVLESGMYELWEVQAWSNLLRDRPTEKYFVRNVAKFGYSSEQSPTAVEGYSQELANITTPSDDEIALVSYQYAAVAKKV